MRRKKIRYFWKKIFEMNKRLKHIIFLLLWVLLPLTFPYEAKSSGSYRTRSFTEMVKTLQVYLNNEQIDRPVLRMGSPDKVTVAFDYMSSDYPHLAYKIEHCRADWSPSQMEEADYLQGFNEVVIEEVVTSMNTTTDYAHFEFQLPNEDLQLKLSGNYVVKVYDTDYPDKILMTGCFSVEDNRIGIEAGVSGKSIYGINSVYQHLTFELMFDDFVPMADELQVVVRQNGRHDNEVRGLKPTLQKPSSFVYNHERELSFEGGREYHVVDFSHRFRYSGEIERISYHKPYYHVDVTPGKMSSGSSYAYYDVNGGFKVHGQEVDGEEEIDYSIVHFTYPAEEPWLDGSLYVMGGFNDQWLEEKNKMTYNFERKQYELALMLKNGGYNFLYAFLPVNWQSASIERAEGSFWDTRNLYQIYVYYRPLGSNYDHDQLVGYFEIMSQ